MKIENKLPRICYVLGRGVPVKADEEFELAGSSAKFRIHKGVVQQSRPDFEWAVANEENIRKMLNFPENIIRRPRFSEDEKSLMRMLIAGGYDHIYRDIDGNLYASGIVTKCSLNVGYTIEESHWKSLPKFLFPQIKRFAKPFNCKSYLESEKKLWTN